uniref:Uncharacterized protein n=1 Tax=Meloidogyne enterolobii TaxID=390850 RepID=A0A6V7UF99_MELEN|nr:unnamed protein product [Meloidogyne enterolobii]
MSPNIYIGQTNTDGQKTDGLGQTNTDGHRQTQNTRQARTDTNRKHSCLSVRVCVFVCPHLNMPQVKRVELNEEEKTDHYL